MYSETRDISLESRGDQILIAIQEDSVISSRDFENALKQHRITNVDRVVDELVGFIKELINDYVTRLRVFQGERIEMLDIPIPRIKASEEGFKIRIGELVGDYRTRVLAESDGKTYSIVLRVVPKIGWDAYYKMIDETVKTSNYVDPKRGFMRALISNTTLFEKWSPIEYSIIVRDLTLNLLTTPLPRVKGERIIVSENDVCRPVVPLTTSLNQRGLDLYACLKSFVEPGYYPLMVAARLNAFLAFDLEALIEGIINRFENSGVVMGIVDELRLLSNTHRALLANPILRDAFMLSARLSTPDHELIEEARRQSGINIIFKSIIDLYENYLNRRPLLEEFSVEGVLTPVSSSKLYELWILSRIMRYLKENFGVERFKLVNESSGIISLNLLADSSFRLKYNSPLEGGFTAGIARSRVRPDIVFVSRKGSIVIDVKYKKKIELEDVYKLTTYIIEFGEPYPHDHARVLYGAFSYLGRRNAWEKHIVKDGLRITMTLCKVDPSDKDDNVRLGVTCLLDKIV